MGRPPGRGAVTREARAVFLDRDGVLVETLVREGRAFAALTLDEFRLCADAGPQVARLRAAGLLPIVFTNQPEMARGTLSPTTLGRMHERPAGPRRRGRHLRVPS